MSVPVRDRKPNDFDCLNKALDLVIYTFKITSNEKFFPSSQLWLINKAREQSYNIFTHIKTANEIKLCEENKEMRLREQKEAQSEIKKLFSTIMIMHRLFHLTMKRVQYWDGLVVSVESLLTSWIDSDRLRLYRGV